MTDEIKSAAPEPREPELSRELRDSFSSSAIVAEWSHNDDVVLALQNLSDAYDDVLDRLAAARAIAPAPDALTEVTQSVTMREADFHAAIGVAVVPAPEVAALIAELHDFRSDGPPWDTLAERCVRAAAMIVELANRADRAERALATASDDALERAAKICDDWFPHGNYAARNEASNIAIAIRAAKGKA